MLVLSKPRKFQLNSDYFTFFTFSLLLLFMIMLNFPHAFSNFWSFGFCFRDDLSRYAEAYPAKFILGYCSTYIFMQTFMIPGTIFMSLLAGALFGVLKGLFLVVFNATAGASSCYFLSKLIGRPLVNWLWPEKLKYFQGEVLELHLLCKELLPYVPFSTLLYFWYHTNLNLCYLRFPSEGKSC